MTNYLAKYSKGLGFEAEPGSSPAERTDQYHKALGEFISTFASVEAAMHLTLWHYAMVRYPIAQAVFSGFKIDAEISLIKRLVDARKLDKSIKDELTELFQQLGVINSARNDILHYGVSTDEKGQAVISNFLLAVDDDRLREFPISVKALADMQHDCAKILVSLHLNHMGPRGRLKLENLKHILKEPWRYKHAPAQNRKSRKPTMQDGRN